jgi:hypothetical protein
MSQTINAVIVREGNPSEDAPVAPADPQVPVVADGPAPAATVINDAPNSGPGVRIAELGRPIQTIYIEPGQSVTVNDLIAEGLIPKEAQVFINNVAAPDGRQAVKNGDEIVSVKNFGAA